MKIPKIIVQIHLLRIEKWGRVELVSHIVYYFRFTEQHT